MPLQQKQPTASQVVLSVRTHLECWASQYKRGVDILEGPHLGASGISEQKVRALELYSRDDLINAYKYFMGE